MESGKGFAIWIITHNGNVDHGDCNLRDDIDLGWLGLEGFVAGSHAIKQNDISRAELPVQLGIGGNSHDSLF